MVKRLTMQTLMAMLTLGLTPGAWADDPVVPVQQDSKVDMGTAITLGQAAAAQAGIEATLGAMQAVASAIDAKPQNPSFTPDGSHTVTEPPKQEHDYDPDVDVIGLPDGGTGIFFDDGSAIIVTGNGIVIITDEAGEIIDIIYP